MQQTASEMDRPYQQALHLVVLAEFDAGYRRVVECMATGLGKTHTATKQIAHFLSCGMSGLFIVDLDFVVDDTADALRRSGIDCGVIQAGKKFVEGKRIYVCSLQTIIARGIRPPADFILLDECHIFAGPECLALLHAYPDALHLGLTATPQRGDGTALGNFYERLVVGPQLGWGMTHGLCPDHGEGPISCCGKNDPYLVRRIVTHAPAKKISKLAWDPVEAWFQMAPGLPTLYFCDSSRHAAELVAKFTEMGVGAEVINSKTPVSQRRTFRDRVRSGKTLVVCTHSVGIKALDLPEIACVGLWRSVGVQGVLQQMVGRGARRRDGKEEMIFIDGVGNVREMGLPEQERAFSLDGDPIKLARPSTTPLTTCKECGAIQPPADACSRCGGALLPDEVKVSKQNQLSEVKEVPLDAQQEAALRKLIQRGLHAVVPAIKRKQDAKAARGERVGRPIGPWLAVEWAVSEFRKRNSVVPQPEVVKKLKAEYEGRA